MESEMKTAKKHENNIKKYKSTNEKTNKSSNEKTISKKENKNENKWNKMKTTMIKKTIKND